MADTKISGLSALGAAPASGDLFAIVDVSDTTQSAQGSTKKLTAANLLALVTGTGNNFTAAQSITLNTAGAMLLVTTNDSTIAYRLRGTASSAEMAWVPSSGKWILRADPANLTPGGGDEIITANSNNKNVAIGTTTDAGKMTVAGELAITDGMTAPAATVGFAKIYVDSADGDLKVRFGDGTIKTLATDT